MDKINSKLFNQLVASHNLLKLEQIKKNLSLCNDLKLDSINTLLNNLIQEFENIEKQNEYNPFDLAFAKMILKRNNFNLF